MYYQSNVELIDGPKRGYIMAKNAPKPTVDSTEPAPMTVAEIMAISLAGVVATQPAVITETKSGTKFDGDVVIDFTPLTVGDAVRRATSNIVIAIAPGVRKSIMDYRSKSEIRIMAPKPGKRERATAITTENDVVEYLATLTQSERDAVVGRAVERHTDE